MNSDVKFPLTLVDEGGETTEFENMGALECNLEDFDSSDQQDCLLTDAAGRRVRLKMRMMLVEVFELEKS